MNSGHTATLKSPNSSRRSGRSVIADERVSNRQREPVRGEPLPDRHSCRVAATRSPGPLQHTSRVLVI